MNVILSFSLLLLSVLQTSFNYDTSEDTVYYFCHSRILDVPDDQQQHVLVTPIYQRSNTFTQKAKISNQWVKLVESDYKCEKGRTSDFNIYNSYEAAHAQQQTILLKYLDKDNVVVEKVEFEVE